MLITKYYDTENKTERAWYDSSMFVHTRMVEDEFENKGDLFVTFKNGATYKYKGVSFSDYFVLIAGGTDTSNGKTLNKVIKSKYEFERVEDVSVDTLFEEMKTIMEKQNDKYNTFFISGHRNITEDEFNMFYKSRIEDTVITNEGCKFVIGDCVGVDIMAQNFLIEALNVSPDRITVYHKGEKPEFVNDKITNLVGGFADDIEKDRAMTLASIEDIAYVRNCMELTGTAQNILRRYSFSI